MVERIAGVPYGEYVKKHILDPLEMSETRYFIPNEDRDRFAKLYIRKGEGELVQDSITYSNYRTLGTYQRWFWTHLNVRQLYAFRTDASSSR